MYLAQEQVKAEEIEEIIPIDSALFEIDKEKSQSNSKVILECIDTILTLDEFVHKKHDCLNLDLTQILISIHGYQDDDKINTIHSILTNHYNNIIKNKHSQKQYLKLFNILHNEIEEELIRTSSFDEFSTKMLKGLFFTETLKEESQGDKKYEEK